MKHWSNFSSRLSVRGIRRLPLRLSLFVLLACCASADAQTTAFTYQGKFADGGNFVTGNYDFQFKLYAVDAGGSSLGTQTKPNILVTNGIFTVQLDFGTCPSCFDGSARFLEIAVKPTSGSTFTTLSPRQPITSTPYAIKTQNLTFNGPFNDGVSTIFAATNTFLGEGTGLNTTSDPILGNPDGKFNSFFGAGAGKTNTTGAENVFFGYRAGTSNTTGVSNTFIGDVAGITSTTGGANTFIGSGTNFTGANPTGGNNSLLGFSAHVNSGVNNGTAIGANAFATQSNSLILGSIQGVNFASSSTDVGIGTTAPTERLHVVGNGLFTGNLTVNGTFAATGSIAASSLTGVVATANGGTGLSASGGVGSYLRSNGTTWASSVLQAGDLTGILGTANGGTGLNTPGASGSYLRSNGSIWASSVLQAGDLTGTLGTANGGTGVSTAGAAGNYLRSDGSTWISGAIQPTDLPGGNANYIQNTTSQQAASFNINGNGTLTGALNSNIVDVTTQYNIGGIRMLSISGTGNTNTFVGVFAGLSNPTGSFNSFFGNGAGRNTVAGANNSFFGSGAGDVNVSGNDNAFFGRNAGIASTASNNSFFGSFAGAANTSGDQNSFFGKEAGRNNTTSGLNSFFGYRAGFSNTTGDFNSYFGNQTGFANTTGSGNSFFGIAAGNSNSTGGGNTFFGFSAGTNNTTSSNNTFIGKSTNFSVVNPTGNNNTLLGADASLSSGVSNGTAVGAGASVTQSNSVVLGSGVNVGIGTTAPATKLHVSGTGIIRTRVDSDSNAGLALTLSNQPTWSVATVTGSHFQIFNDASGQNAFWIDSASNNVGIGTTSPADKLHVAGDIRVGNSGTNGCLKNNNGGAIIGTCSSDARFKRDITPFPNLLSRIVQLRPVHFHWRASDYPDRNFGQAQEAGLIAQEVEKVIPELVTEDDQGYKAVNYSELPLFTLQAVKELHQENEALRKQIETQQKLIEALRILVCEGNPQARLCK